MNRWNLFENRLGSVDGARRFDTVDTGSSAMHACANTTKHPTHAVSRRKWTRTLLLPAFWTLPREMNAMASGSEEQEVLERRKRTVAQKKEDMKKKAEEKQKEEQFKSDQMERRKEKARQRMRKLQQEGT